MPVNVDGREFLLVDTPGFNDTYKGFKRSDARILADIAQALTAQTQLGVKLVTVDVPFMQRETAKQLNREASCTCTISPLRR